MSVIVAGSGVIGLTCALVLAEHGYQVTVVADWIPGDAPVAQYASPWAGAHFRPFPSVTSHDSRDKALTRKTLLEFEKLAVDSPESSIKFVEGTDYLENPTQAHWEGQGFEGLEGFRILDKSELPEGVKFGCSYRTWCVNCPVYLEFLVRKLKFRHGVKFHKQKLTSLKEISTTFPNSTIVNATGTGLLVDGGYDPECFPIRGQTLTVRGPQGNPYFHRTITHQSADGLWTFVITRPLDGGFIVGGTKQIGETDNTIRAEDTEELVTRAKKLYPELLINGEFDIQRVNVGLRPARKGGMRLEKESVSGTTIIHAYGVGGMGYEVSFGVAHQVYKLLNPSSKL